MTLTPLNPPLTDLGGFPVVWDTDMATIIQDPRQGGTNVYGAGDLFRAPNGDLYQLTAQGTLNFIRSAAPPVVPGASMGGAGPAPITGGGISSAGPSWESPPAGGTPAISVGGDPTRFGHQVVAWLGSSSFIRGISNGVLLGLGAVGYSMLRQRRGRRGGGLL